MKSKNLRTHKNQKLEPDASPPSSTKMNTFLVDELKLNPHYLVEIVKNESKLYKKKNKDNRLFSISKEVLLGDQLSMSKSKCNDNDEPGENSNVNEDNVWKERLEIPNFWKAFAGVGKIRRIVWIIIFLISFGLFLYETVDRIYLLIDPARSSTVKLAYEHQLSFPSMTICPSYKFRFSLLQKFNVDRFGCKPGQRYCSWDIPYNLATHTETIIKLCRYKKHYSCSPGTEESGKWHRTMTSLGRCFTYEASEPIKSGGDSNAFEVMIDPLLWDQWGNTSGIRVYIHGHNEIPLAEINGININHGSTVNFALQVKRFNRVNDVRRNPCVLLNDYSQSICIMSCVYDLVREKANSTCGAPFMQVFDIPACRVKDEIEHFSQTFDSVVNNGSSWNNCNNVCQEPCIQTTYTPITTSLGFTNTNSSLVNITIYFSDMWVEQIVEKWDYNIEEFVSDTGGFLNLFLGASFVTIIQFSDYFLALSVFWSKNFLANLKHLQNKVVIITVEAKQNTLDSDKGNRIGVA